MTGAVTSIIFVATNVLSRLIKFANDKSHATATLTATTTIRRRRRRIVIATILLLNK